MLTKIFMLVFVTVMTFFGAILQYENIMNLLSFWVYLTFIVSFLLFLALTNDAILQNSVKVYKPASSITVVHRVLNITAIIALVYHGYILLPIVFILCLALGLMIREVIKREYELTLTEGSSKIVSQ